MSRSSTIFVGWVLAAGAALELAGCQEAPAPAATSATAAKEAVSKPTAAQQPTAKETAKDSPAANAAPASADDKPATPPPPAANQPRVDITFDAIKLDMQKDDPFRPALITPKIQALEGRRVKIRGYILPSFQQAGLTQFVLVRDNLQCCFGPGAALYDAIVVEMRPGRSTDFTIRPVAVEGVFAVRELLDPDGKTLAIYHLDGEAVQ
jgi:hypothetical protein